MYKVLDLKFKAFNKRALEVYVPFCVRVAKEMGIQTSGIIRMPVETRRMTVLRSPHVDKTARDQFEMQTHSRLVRVFNTSELASQKLVRYIEENLPADIFLKRIVYTYGPIPLTTPL